MIILWNRGKHMNYTKLISKKKQYKYSVNICFDLQDEDRLADFIPNVTTTEIIREYLGGIIRGNADAHSRILYGSYGTGKSHLLTVMSAILGHINTSGKGLHSFLRLLGKYDQELAHDIKQFVTTGKPYLVVPVYSDYDDFSKCVTLSLKKALEQKEIDVCFKGFYDEALGLLDKWMAGEESFKRLKEECKDKNLKLEDLKRGLSSYETPYEKIFASVYAGMSYGASFNSTTGNLIDNLNTANAAIQDKYKGIIFVFDEFGRYVEDYGETLKVKTIQDFAEYCDHSDYDNYLILVSHKQLSMYAESMKKSISDEWKKIEGRFKLTSINIKYDQCLSLIGHVIPKTSHWVKFKEKYEKQLNDLYNQAWDFKGFMLPPESNGENPFENGFPLHPITLFALDRLSKKTAQNERTFFTYLAGDEENSLFTQLEQYDTDEFHFVGLDSIYDYFELNIKSYKTDEAYASYKKLQYAMSKLGNDRKESQIKILKAIATINIIGDTESLCADRSTLSSVIDGTKEEVNAAIDELEQKKIIKFMRQYGFYDFFDSSIFDLESMIEEKVQGISDEIVVSIMNEKFTNFVMYPYRYNELYHINRVFIPMFAHKADLVRRTFYNTWPKYYDGVTLFVLDEQVDEEWYKELTSLPERTLLIINGKSRVLEEEVKRYIAVQYYFSKRDELAKDDPTVVKELDLYLNEQEAIVLDLIRKWRLLQNAGTYVMTHGEFLAIDNEKELSEVLSNITEVAFNRTLIVNNDLVNKNTLTGPIRLARKKVLENIMSKQDVYEGVGFLSPEFNILRSTLSKNGLIDNDSVGDSCKVREDEINLFLNGTPAGAPVMGVIRSMLKRAENDRLPLKELYQTLKEQPYGLRDGYIPVLLAYELRNYQNVSLYFHGKEHSYTADELVKALEQPENYTLFICNWNVEETNYIESLEKLFARYLPKGDDLNRLEELFKAVNTHYASISKSARTTELYVSDIAKKYRDILNLSYKDYNDFFFSVLPKLNPNLQELVVQIETIKEELESVQEKQYSRILRVTKNVFGVKENDNLMEFMVDLFKNDWESKSQKAFDYTTNGVLDLVSRAHKLSEKQFIAELAKTVTGFEMTYWVDNKINDFEEILRESVNRLFDYNPQDSLLEGEMKITIESANGNPVVSQFSQEELSIAGKTMLNKMKSTLSNFGGAISYEEKISIMAQILKEIIN